MGRKISQKFDTHLIHAINQQRQAPIDAFLSVLDTRLMRVWESTVASLGEEYTKVSFSKSIASYLFDDTDPAISGIFISRLNSRLSVKWDASVSSFNPTEIATSYGGFIFFKKNKGAQDTRIYNASELKQIIEDTALEVFDSSLLDEEGVEARNLLLHKSQNLISNLKDENDVEICEYPLYLDEGSNAENRYFNTESLSKQSDVLLKENNFSPEDLVNMAFKSSKKAGKDIFLVQANAHGFNIDLSADPNAVAAKKSWNVKKWIHTHIVTPSKNLTLQNNQIEKITESLVEMFQESPGFEEYIIETIQNELSEKNLKATPKNIYNILVELFNDDIENDSITVSDIERIIISTINPPSISFADTNWGAGETHDYLSLIHNPISGKNEIWLADYDGTNFMINSSAQEWEKEDWTFFSNPKMYSS